MSRISVCLALATAAVFASVLPDVAQASGGLSGRAGSIVGAPSQARQTLSLSPGTELVRGQRYWSQSGSHFLTLNPDGNLVIARADGGYVWGFDTQPNVDFRRVGRVVWQADGNLAAYSADGGYIWSALTENPDPNSRLVLQSDGTLQIIAGNQVKWSSAPRHTLTLQPGTELVRGQRYWSQSGEHFLTLNPDGNLVVARAEGGYVWGFDTQPNVDFRRVARVVWQEDGNLAAYAADGGYIWSALTENPDPNSRLVLQSDGALQIVSGNQVRWNSLGRGSTQTAGGGEPSTPAPATGAGRGTALAQTDTGNLTLTSASASAAAARGPSVAFVSTDGSASVGSRTVFILRNTATGESTLVPVVGAKEATRTVVNLAPGTYSVTPPPPSIGQLTTFTATNVSATQITVPSGAPNAARPAVTVSFSLEAQRAPVAMLISDVTASSVRLSWGAGEGVEVGQYVLVRSDGPTPAANASSGTRVPLSGPTATSATVQGLAPNREYTLTLFATSRSGEALPARAFTATTANPNSNAAAFAVAPNTIVPTDFASLRAERVGENWVRVSLNPARVQRGSSSGMPGFDANAVQGGGCVVGTPFLLKTDVAGDNSFYGVIDVCESSAQGVSRAIVNTDVPLSSVFSYYHLASSSAAACYDPVTGRDIAANAAECSGNVPDGPQQTRPTGGDVTQLRPPSRAGTGEVQVTLLWASADDLDLHVTDPRGATINWQAANSASGGKLDIDDRGAACGTAGERAENVFWTEGAPRGTYTVEVRNYRECGASAVAKLQVRIGGELIIDRVVRVGTDGPITFSVPGDEASASGMVSASSEAKRGAFGTGAVLQRASYSEANPLLNGAMGGLGSLHRASYAPPAQPLLPTSSTIASIAPPAREISCEGSRNATFDLRPYFGPHFQHDLELDGASLTWDVEAGITAGINPHISFTGSVECEVELAGRAFQLSTYPVPVNLELKPEISASATATVTLEGPQLGLTLGIQSEGSVSAAVEWCDSGRWYIPDYPCVGINLDHDTRPLARFDYEPATATLEGTLEFGAGVQANLGIGIKNDFVTAKTGFSLRMYPLAAELRAVVGTENCIEASVGAKLGVDFLAEAYMLGLGDELRETLYESDVIAYPGASFEIGECEDDD